MSKNEYTALQKKIISGEIPIDSVRGNFIVRLRNKALELKDFDVVEMADKQISINIKKARLLNIERTKEAYYERKQNGFEWKPPRSEEYTYHQKQIIKGEIPIDNVITNDLVRICVKARQLGDHVIEELMLDLIKDRKIKCHERTLERRRLARQDERFCYGQKGKLTK